MATSAVVTFIDIISIIRKDNHKVYSKELIFSLLNKFQENIKMRQTNLLHCEAKLPQNETGFAITKWCNFYQKERVRFHYKVRQFL